MDGRPAAGVEVPRFERGQDALISRLGNGALGGKAQSLVRIQATLEERFGGERQDGVEVSIPRMIVLATDVFESFMDKNGLWEVALSDATDDRIAHAFQKGELPTSLVGDLKSLVADLHRPLAVRSSSLLEDALFRPFAGVYATKMVPNDSTEADARFRELAAAIKLVWASTYFHAAKSYIRATESKTEDERMAVIVQEVAGRRHDERFYPDVSGVARSYNYYPVGRAKPEDGVVNLALGLGKTIVDGGVSWAYAPTRPKAPPPFGSVNDLLKNTQLGFWAVRMGPPPEEDPLREDEHLVHSDLSVAELDGTLRFTASTLDPRSGRLVPGTGPEGPRVLDFGPLLKLGELPVNAIVREMLEACDEALDTPVEIEFALTIEPKSERRARLAFLQVRPMVVSHEQVEITAEDLADETLLVGSERALGNGTDATIRDVVYVRPESFDAKRTREIAGQLDRINGALVAEHRPYLLIGFGRWGSSDPWLGIPVEWGQIAGARAIVEATIPAMNVEPSQGSHFFHNISSFQVAYLFVRHELDEPIDWGWLDGLPAESETELVRHVRVPGRLEVRLDGRRGVGGIWRRRHAAHEEKDAAPRVDPVVALAASGHRMEAILSALQERAKELNCLYRVDEILSADDDAEDAYARLVEAIPPGWQFPDDCEAQLTIHGETYATRGYRDTPWTMWADVVDQGEKIGELRVCYTAPRPIAEEGPFLVDERRLLNTIAERVGYFVMQRRLSRALRSWETAVESIGAGGSRQWGVILDFLRRTDHRLLMRITRKMINYLCWSGISEAEALLQRVAPVASDAVRSRDENVPLAKTDLRPLGALTKETFGIASAHLTEDEISTCIQSWIREDKASFLINAIEGPSTALPEIASAIDRYQSLGVAETELPPAVQTGLRVSLLRRLFTDQLDYINVAKRHVTVADFYELLERIVSSAESHGKLGGKSAGLFLARKILAKAAAERDIFADVRVPKTWYVTSDGILSFIRFNNLDDVYNRKYMDIDRVRQDYPHIIQVFKNSHFPPEVLTGLSAALDDLAERPLIVRSSSLLEDRTGAAFSGKYKSLFLANTGTKKERLDALTDAIAEVYASTFGPDPIEYRAERNLLDVHEEMGIMIQEVVGQRIGPYFFPAYAGVAFSRNEFRWSPRIQREDGLIRLVPGLGTRAVDRLGDDYPVLVAPGKPNQRVNVTPEEVVRYAPRFIDLINMETGTFETRELSEVLREVGALYPSILRLVSVVEQDRIRRPSGLMLDFERDDHVVTFEGLFRGTPFVEQMRAMLETLERELGYAVDVEFASDGSALYLLQCRPQSRAEQREEPAIPRDIARERLLFDAHRYVSTGDVGPITHVVYVDPERYDALESLDDLAEVGRLVGRLNKVLPKRHFILMGPGRWGSRGDIKLGVRVTYSDINNTAMLVEIARQKGNYTPDLSFGTHFFQDLVEAEIRYLPLYPDDDDVVFNEAFFRRTPSVLRDLVPGSERLEDVVRVIDVPAQKGGQVVRVLMNAELDEAVGVLVRPEECVTPTAASALPSAMHVSEDHWRWRTHMAQRIAAAVDPERYGVKAMYVFGSVKNATAGPGSDIDLLVHVEADPERRAALAEWLDGWSRSLAEMNYLRTGYQTDGLLDVHFVTDEDIEKKTSFASKIDAVTDAARALEMGEEAEGE